MVDVSAASLSRRLVARLADLVLLGPAFVLFLLPLYGVAVGSFSRGLVESLGGQADNGPVVPVEWWFVMGLALVVLVLYEPVMVAMWDATLGKLAAGVRVVRITDGAEPGWFRSS